MTNQVIPTDAVVAYLNAHFRPDTAADLLAAAQPLMAIAWEEGEHAGAMNHAAEEYPDVPTITNPYRTTK